jgi:hypothetical protein
MYFVGHKAGVRVPPTVATLCHHNSPFPIITASKVQTLDEELRRGI